MSAIEPNSLLRAECRPQIEPPPVALPAARQASCRGLSCLRLSKHRVRSPRATFSSTSFLLAPAVGSEHPTGKEPRPRKASPVQCPARDRGDPPLRPLCRSPRRRLRPADPRRASRDVVLVLLGGRLPCQRQTDEAERDENQQDSCGPHRGVGQPQPPYVPEGVKIALRPLGNGAKALEEESVAQTGAAERPVLASCRSCAMGVAQGYTLLRRYLVEAFGEMACRVSADKRRQEERNYGR